MKMWWNPVEAQDWLATLSETPLDKLMSQAEIAMETMVTVRDRVISAYEEIMRMPI